ncbi:MAG TPA: hypothetical protein VGB77_14040 [Abditibacteriaceae bacterium]|jgi:hypothetical protein
MKQSLKFFRALGLSVVALPIALPAWAAPVGMAAQVKGSVTLKKADKEAPLKLLQRVESGDVVRTGAGAQAIIVLFDGGARYQIGAGQSATIRPGQVIGATKMAGMSGPSAAVAQKLGGARVGAVMARPARTVERMTPQFPGWLPLDKPKFEWLPLTGALNYTFTLFDQFDNVIWSVQTDKLFAEFPANAPALREQRPYLWRLSGFGTTGRPVQDSRFGLVTFLSSAEGEALNKLAGELQAQAKNAEDKTPFFMLAEAYREKGVLGRTLEVLEEESLRDEEGLEGAKSDVIQALSPFTRALLQDSNTP